MCINYFTPSGFVLMLVLTGCAAHRMDVNWPEPRPLGKDVVTYQPPYRPSAAASAALELEEPTGILTLRQALSLALMKNPELKAFSWEVRVREARRLQDGLLPNPEFGVEVENFGGTGAFQNFDGTETTFQLSQMIELGGKRSKRTRVAEMKRYLAGWDYESTRMDVLTRGTKAFVDVLAAQELLALTEELVSLSEHVFNTVSERVESGKVSPVEGTKASVALATSRIELERAKRGLAGARQRLAATWGGISPTFEEVAGRLDIVKTIPSVEQLVSRISQNPEIVRWVAEIEQRRAAVKLEEARRIPNLTLSGGVRRFSETPHKAFVLEVSFPLPLFDRNQGGGLEARYRLAKADEVRRASEVRVHAALAEAYQALSTSFVETTALRSEVLPGAQSAFETTSEGYRQGKFDYLDVLDAQRSLFEARCQYINTLGAYHKAVADVERLIAEPLDFVKKTLE